MEFRSVSLLCVLFVVIVCFERAFTSGLKTEVMFNKYDKLPQTTEYVPTDASENSHKMERFQVAKFDFPHVASPFIITAWIFTACCAKIIFHVNAKFGSYCPESCMLLIVGVILGVILFYSGCKVGPLTPTVFFMFMLPPIVFDAGYFMPNRLFFDNIISILVYAVIGTVWNALSIGFTLWAIGTTGIFSYTELPLMHMLLFSSIVSAVDPVAVLAVFEEIHVNEVLYIIVFGESLLNDAVTVIVLLSDWAAVGPSHVSGTNSIFFTFMLLPIVFDAGYSMPNELFFDNIISILFYAAIGTVWNALSIGFTLWAIGTTGIFSYTKLPLMHMLLFSSIASAVNPVAVLAVFEEIHVNEVLYIIVFGKSLLNDAVTVVLYHMFEGYIEMGPSRLLPIDFFSGIASFFVVSLGGTFIGIVFGLLTSFLSKYTTSVSVIEPMFPFIMGYLAYLTAEMFHLSGILSLVFCGITMKNYVEENISNKSHVTVKYVTKMLATASEAIIFVVLGVSTVNDNHEWDIVFILLTIFLCTVYRAIGVVVLSAFLNRFRLHQMNGVEQFIMSYGGLRGAVAFALALIIKKDIIPSKDMMVTTIITVVYFTVFAQGMTIKFFVRILKVPVKRDREISMNERLHSTVIDHVMGGIEEVADQFFGNHKIRDRFKYYNNKYLRRFLTNHTLVNEPKIFATHSKLNLMDAMNMVNSGSKLTLEADAPLSTVLRNYTQVNLTKLAPDELSSPSANASPLLNIDIGELTYNPSFKDLADSEIHHILEDSMFKPPKRSRRYSRSQFYESPPKHPPFHHHMRMQIRRLMSERHRRKKHRSNSSNGFLQNGGKNHAISKIYLDSGHNHPGVMVTSPVEANDDDGGITFTAKSFSLDVPEPPVRTVTETVLPWKRDEDIASCDPAKPQEEFPTWVDNRDYYPGYLSPSPTFLDKISDRPYISKVRTIHESIDEEDEPSFEKLQKQTSNQSTAEYKRRSWSSLSKEQRLNSSSADEFSFTSAQSDSPTRDNSADTVSIECPDVAVDIEPDPADTKL